MGEDGWKYSLQEALPSTHVLLTLSNHRYHPPPDYEASGDYRNGEESVSAQSEQPAPEAWEHFKETGHFMQLK